MANSGLASARHMANRGLASARHMANHGLTSVGQPTEALIADQKAKR